jgi:glycosyltransferase involved in cell wall biosynthesis
MKVSIITSCFNREATIKDAIESVISQNYPDIEYIVIDGASNDKSIEIIKQYQQHIAKFISEKDKGMYEAINKGIKQATGDIIGLVHSDDFLYSKDTITHIVQQFERTGADLIYGNGLFVDFYNTNKIIRNWKSGVYSKKKIRYGWLPLHPTVYIKKDCFQQLGLYDESFKIAADSDLLIRYLYESNLKISYLDEYIIKMRMGGLSTNPKKIKQKWSEDLKLYRNHGFMPLFTLGCKIISKIPQFITAKITK